MPTTIKKFKVFVASPGDCREERSAIKEICTNITYDLGSSLGCIIEPVTWEMNTRPGIGLDAQEVINKQISDDYDILMTVFSTRFGSPTGRFNSGTEEEFFNALSRNKLTGSPSFLAYFSDMPIDRVTFDPEQLSRLNNFRKRVREIGVYYFTYDSLASFSLIVRRHLIDEITNLLKLDASKLNPAAEEETVPQSAKISHVDRLLQEDAETLEAVLVEKSNAHSRAFVGLMSELNARQTKLTTQYSRAAGKMQSLGRKNSVSALSGAQKELEKAADLQFGMVSALGETSPKIEQELLQVLTTTQRISYSQSINSLLLRSEKEFLLGGLVEMRSSILSADTAINQLISVAENVPSIKGRFDVSRKMLVASLKDFSDLLKRSVLATEYTEKSITELEVSEQSLAEGQTGTAEAVSDEQHRPATLEEVMAHLAETREDVQPVLDYLRDK